MIKSKKKLDIFLYLLLRDCAIPCGEVEKLVQIAGATDDEAEFSNDYLAGYAKDIRKRLEEGK